MAGAAAESISEADLKEWTEYKLQYKKVYDDEAEDKKRFKIYMETKKRIVEHNALYEAGKTTFTIGINQFADLHPHEVCCNRRGHDKSEHQ